MVRLSPKPSIYSKVIEMRVSDEQLGVIIANKIKESGLNGVFNASSIDNIKEKLKAEYRKMRSAPIDMEDSLIPENQVTPSNTFPYGEDDVQDETGTVDAGVDISPALEAGEEPTDVAYEPSVYTPELPDVLKNMQPSKLVVMELNDIIENGENLANKPFRMMDDIDSENSMKSLWNAQGATKAEVYQMKFERIGDMVFDYANGTASFTQTPSPSEFHDNPNDVYRENPYAQTVATDDGTEVPTSQDIETYVKTSVDIEDIVKKTVLDIMAKAHEDQVNAQSKESMGLAPVVPDAIHESFQLGNPVNGVEFLGKRGNASSYRFEGNTYIIYESKSI